MNSVDLLVLVVILLNGAIGAYRGFTWQVFRLGSLVLAFWLGTRGAGPASQAPPIAWLDWDATTSQILAWVLIFVAVYLLMGWIGNRLRAWIERANLTSSDRSLGFLLGSAKGAIFVAIALHVLLMFRPILPAEIEGEIWGENASRAAQIHNETFKDVLNDLTPDEFEEQTARAITSR